LFDLHEPNVEIRPVAVDKAARFIKSLLFIGINSWLMMVN